MDFELRTIPGCPHTGSGLELFSEALVLEAIHGKRVAVREIGTDEQAAALDFHGSPTFSVGGTDLFPSSTAPAVTCRVYPTPAGPAGLPTLESLRAAIRAAVDAPLDGETP